MKNIKSKAIGFAVFVACFAFLVSFFSVGAIAQDAENKAPAKYYMSITTVKVKPEMVNDFENIVKAEYNPAYSKGGGGESDVWQMAMGNVFDYVFVQPVKNFAQMDGPSPVMKGMGEKAPAFFANISKMVSSVDTVIVEARPDLSYSPKMTAPPKVAVVAYVRVDGSKAADFEKFIINEYLPVVKKAGVMGFWTSKTVFGGNSSEYTFVTAEENFAELDKGSPVEQVMKPAEAAKMFEKMPAGAIRDVEVYVARHKPDLSVAPPAQTAAN